MPQPTLQVISAGGGAVSTAKRLPDTTPTTEQLQQKNAQLNADN